MTKEKYIEVIRTIPLADELARIGYMGAVQMLAIRDEDISEEDMVKILETIKEVEE